MSRRKAKKTARAAAPRPGRAPGAAPSVAQAPPAAAPLAPAVGRWGHLVSAAFRLDQQREQAGVDAGGRATLELLDSALEVFPPSLDPVDDFEGYAVRRLLLSVREAVAPLVSGAATKRA